MTDAEVLIEQAQRAYDDSDHSGALALAESAYAAAETSFERANALYIQMRVQHYRGQYHRSVALADQIEQLLSPVEGRTPSTDVLRLLGKMLSIAGASHRQRAELDLALDKIYQQLAIGQRLGDMAIQSSALNGLGGIYYYLRDYDRAHEYSLQVVALQRELGNDLRLAIALGNLADINAHRSQPAIMLGYAQESLRLMEQHGIDKVPQHSARTLIVLGKALAQLDRLAEAQMAFEQALAMVSSGQLDTIWIDAASHFSDVLIRMGQYGRALDLLRRAAALVEANPDNAPWAYDLYRQLAEALDAMGDSGAALGCYRRHMALKDHVFNAERDERIRIIEARYRIETTQREADLFRQQAQAAEAQREQDRQYFERLARLKDDLLAGAGHDLKGPIASIRAAVYLLRRQFGAQEPELLRYLNNIETQAARVTDLIGDVVEVARLETGRSLTIAFQPITPVIEEAVAQQRDRALAKQQSLNFDPPDLPTFARFDTASIHRVMDNLISNAIKYTPLGGMIRVSITSDDRRVTIAVTDTGLGIPPKAIPHIFERFYRIDRPEQENIEGTGLGLSIVKTIIDQHGGSLHVEPVMGGGTRFSFTLAAQ